jgi:hypothetical protein
MKIIEIMPCYRITLENDSYGVETYIDADSKIQITFENGNILTGSIERVEYGTSLDENDTLVIRAENGELYILLGNRIKDIKELNE